MGFTCALPVASSPVCLCSVPDVKTAKGHFYTLIHPRITEAQGAEFSGAGRHSSYDVGNRRRALKVTLSITGVVAAWKRSHVSQRTHTGDKTVKSV